MSELIQKNDNRATIRWKLLTGASALALTAYVSSGDAVRAEDSSQPQIWIELGGQLSQLQDSEETFSPPLMAARPSIFEPSQKFEKPPRFNIDEEGKITFKPDNSDWIFFASIRYGRSESKRHVHQQTYPKPAVLGYLTNGVVTPYITWQPIAAKFADTKAQHSERHTILDFQAGKDIGIGLFGNKDASSVVSVGVRFAQFTSKANIALKSDPDWHFAYKYYPTLVTSFGFTNSRWVSRQPYHSNLASLRAQRSFHGVGPLISWNSSLPFAGNTQDGELSVDWGVNAALLFGRQKTKTSHETTERYHQAIPNFLGYTQRGTHVTLYHHPGTPARIDSRNVTVPNIGGSIGLSWQLQNFKMNFGYKADFYFNAIDGGIDARKNEDRAFYGPYASISIGLGD